MTAFIFVPLLAMTCIVGAVVGLYAARMFTVILENTAAGNTEVVWDDESFLDWVAQGVVLSWHVTVWSIPVVLISTAATRGVDENWRVPIILAVAALGTWVMLPVGILSSMSAESRWAVLSLPALAKLLRHPGDWLAYSSLTAPGIALGLAAIAWAWRWPGFAAFMAAGIVVSLAWVTTARLLGHLGCRVLRRGHRRNPKDRPLPTARRATASRAELEPAETETPAMPAQRPRVQPSELPPIESPYDGPITGYDVRFDDNAPSPPAEPPPPSEPPRKTRASRQNTSRSVRSETADSQTAVSRPLPVTPDRLEAERLKRVTTPPTSLSWTDARLWMFLAEAKTSPKVVLLAVGSALVGGMIAGLRELWPM